MGIFSHLFPYQKKMAAVRGTSVVRGERNMDLLTLFTLAVGLSMDAFAVAAARDCP